jgi:hypothetical protein
MLNILDNVKTPEEFKPSSPAKISLKDGRAFSLPAGPLFSCPGATDACTDCYAMKYRHLFSNVQAAFAKNWLLIKKFEKKKDTNGAVKALLEMISDDAKVFRIHESGDFYSQWYINVWAEVVKQRKDITFWAYTRSFDFDFSKLTKQKNFALWASTDQYNQKAAKHFVRRFKKSGVKHAYGPYEHEKEIPENSFICPVTSGKLDVEGACEKCLLCVVKKRVNKNVVFLGH